MGTGVVKVAIPGPRLFLRKLRARDRGSQVAPGAYLLVIRDEAGDRRSALKQNECDVLIVGAIDAVGKISGGVGHGDGLFHTIRLYDFMILVNYLSSCVVSAVNGACASTESRDLRSGCAADLPDDE